MEYIPIRVSDLIRQVNRDIFLPAIQREFVWGPDRVERLFDSIMADFPIGSFLYWKLDQKNKDEWPVYEFVREFDAESPHNQAANMAGIAKDITLVLDGQQRITSLFVGLRGSFRYFRYKWRKTRLYLNLLKPPIPNEDNPEELTYEFAFREDADPSDGKLQLWYPVGRILDFKDGEDAKDDMDSRLVGLPEEQRKNANRLISRLHNRIHTDLVGNYYEEKSQEYEKVLQVFVRANSGGQPLEYSDLLLATATAKWETLDARTAIHDFTDSINAIGSGYSFGKDFVLKACLYLTDNLPVQYKVKNFTKPNLRKIEANWEKIKESLATTVRLISRFGFNVKNVVAPLALLPIALFLLKRGNHAFDTSSSGPDADAQVAIRRWFVFATLQNAFGSSSDTILARLRDLLKDCGVDSPFPAADLYKSLGIKPYLNDAEIDRILGYGYQGRYTNLVLSLLYPDRDWKDAVFHEDHIFPQSEFQVRKLRKRGFDEQKIQSYLSRFNTLCNLQLLTESENLSKNATPFEKWLPSRDAAFRARHLIPELPTYDFDHFEDLAKARTDLVVNALKTLLPAEDDTSKAMDVHEDTDGEHAPSLEPLNVPPSPELPITPLPGTEGITVLPPDEKCQHFTQQLQARQGETQARIGQTILAFLKSKAVRFTWRRTKHRESVVARLVNRGQKQWLMGMTSDGRIWIPFGQMKKMPPFDDRSKREELARRLNALGAEIPEKRLERFPGFAIAVLQETDRLQRFLQVLEWSVQEIGTVVKTSVGQGADPGFQRWDEASFFRELEQQKGAVVASAARAILDWVTPRAARMCWNRGRIGVACPMLGADGKGYLLRLTTNGRVEIPFSRMKRQQPFSDDSKRHEFLGRLNQVPGVTIQEKAVDKWAKIPLLAFKGNTSEFLKVLDWAVKQIIQCSSAVKRSEKMSKAEMDEVDDEDLIDSAVQAEYERLLASPDELKALADRLEIPEDGMLSQADIWDEAYRLQNPDDANGNPITPDQLKVCEEAYRLRNPDSTDIASIPDEESERNARNR